jgi:hypothetical protein
MHFGVESAVEKLDSFLEIQARKYFCVTNMIYIPYIYKAIILDDFIISTQAN